MICDWCGKEVSPEDDARLRRDYWYGEFDPPMHPICYVERKEEADDSDTARQIDHTDVTIHPR